MSGEERSALFPVGLRAEDDGQFALSSLGYLFGNILAHRNGTHEGLQALFVKGLFECEGEGEGLLEAERHEEVGHP